MMDFSRQRKQLVDYLEKLGVVTTPEIRRVLLKVKRELFIPPAYRDSAYQYNVALPIAGGMTISAMNMHASFLSAADLKSGEKVLEIGAGSGILLAYLRELVGANGRVFGVEINGEAYAFAKKNLENTGYARKVELVLGDGSKGLPQIAPFDKIISSASATADIPKAWLDQLKVGGIIVTPMGRAHENQELVWIKKTKSGLVKKNLGGVVFIELKEK